MSKYIIDLPDNVKKIVCFHVGNANAIWTTANDLDYLEELNSDYINEHYGSLQDEAYQKGFEDGKKSIDKGCEGCRYALRFANDEPCKSCANCYTSKYEPLPERDDSIKVGDEVEAPRGKAVVTAVKDDLVHYFYSGGDYGCIETDNVRKTGKHYDIQSILEAMRT